MTSMCSRGSNPTTLLTKTASEHVECSGAAHFSAEERVISFIYSHFKLPRATGKSQHFQE